MRITRAARYGRDALALLVLVAFGLLALGTSRGGSVAGQPLDAAWARVQQRHELRVAIDVGFAPFSGMRGQQVIGYDADLARAVATRLGAEAVFVPTGFDALYDVLGRSEVDLIASALPYTPGLGWRARFSRFYFNAGQVLLAPATSPLTDTTPLDGLVVGAVLGSDGDTLLRRAEHDGAGVVRRDQYDETAALVADLTAGTLDAAVVDNAAALSAINDGQPLRLVRALSVEPYVLAVAPPSYLLHEEVNRALEALEQRGCMAALNERWLRNTPPTGDALPPACSEASEAEAG